MPWRGLGHIFTANGQRAWMQSHCSMPFAEPLTGTYCRIWFTARNKNNHSHVAWLEIDLQEPSKILALSQRPALAPGFPSTFDELRVMGSWIVKKGTQNWHYSVGRSDGGAKRDSGDFPSDQTHYRDRIKTKDVRNPEVVESGSFNAFSHLQNIAW